MVLMIRMSKAMITRLAMTMVLIRLVSIMVIREVLVRGLES